MSYCIIPYLCAFSGEYTLRDNYKLSKIISSWIPTSNLFAISIATQSKHYVPSTVAYLKHISNHNNTVLEIPK